VIARWRGFVGSIGPGFRRATSYAQTESARRRSGTPRRRPGGSAARDALRRLEQHDARQARIVECRFFGGMNIHETGEALGVSPATVKRGWTMAQVWLHRELTVAYGADT